MYVLYQLLIVVLFENCESLSSNHVSQSSWLSQEWAAHVLGIPSAKVTCQVRRIGGGFGGKETRSLPITSALAVAAHHLQRPVRISLKRDVDMSITGQRHPFIGYYKAGFSREGKILALDVKLYSNGGNSLDLSMAVMDRALLHIDNAYSIPVINAVGKVCKTNIPSNTAFRGFGGPQGMMVIEAIMQRAALKLGMPAWKLRELNLYRENELTHYVSGGYWLTR